MDTNFPTSNIPVQPAQQPFTPQIPSSPIPKFIFIIGGLLILIVGLFGGYYLTKSFSSEKSSVKQLKDIHKITSIQPSSILDPTVNWKTFNNAKFGFILTVPNDWYIYDHTDNVDYPAVILEDKKNSQEPLKIYVEKNVDNLLLNDWLEKNKPLFLKNHTLEKIQIGTINGLRSKNEAIGFESGLKSYTETVYLSYNHFVYGFYFESKNQQTELNSQILSTFKFIDTTYMKTVVGKVEFVPSNADSSLSGYFLVNTVDGFPVSDMSGRGQKITRIPLSFQTDEAKIFIQKNVGKDVTIVGIFTYYSEAPFLEVYNVRN